MGGFLCVERFQSAKNPVGAGVYPFRRDVRPANDSIGVDHEQRSLAVARLIVIHTVLSRHGALGLEVGQQWEMQFSVSRVGRMTPGAVYGNAYQLSRVSAEFREKLVEQCEFIAANRTPVSRIKS